ncbi:MAG TPA: hypothetical protein VE575_06535 [Acidimicrobiales bacterium]|jgi:hypothetical protein|nr:hypothetical protein [Acidimicrobiales bacterium]
MGRLRLGVAVLVVGVLGAACGDDGGGGGVFGGGDGGGSNGDSSTERGQEYVDAMVAWDDENDDLTEDEKECVSRGWVDVIGVDALDAATSPEELAESEGQSLSEVGLSLDEQQRDGFWEALAGCIDVRQLVLDQIGEDVPEEAVACLDENMSDDFLRQFVLTGMINGEEAIQEDQELTNGLLEMGQACPEAFSGS